MKNILTIICFILAINTSAQLIVDDFTTGEIQKLEYKDNSGKRTLLQGEKIIGQYRQVFSKVNQNPYEQDMQLSIKDGELVMSYAYDTSGTTYVNYGVNKDGNAPLNLDVSKYKALKIAFEAKSTKNGIYISLFTGNTRATYSKHVQAREGKFMVTVPFTEIKPIGEKFTFSDIDYIRLQFDSRSKTGCNMGISKIWFE